MNGIELASGYTMPALGFGTWESTGNDCRRAVKHALDAGYTHIDSAAAYGNQHDIGQALKEYGVEREKLFITSKIFRDSLVYEDAVRQAEASLRELMTEYLDLLLIHWPNDSVPMEETFSAFEKLHNSGKVKSIGVSNFSIRNLEKALKKSDLPISINQVEYHPLLNQEKLFAFCRGHGVNVTAYSPLARGVVFGNPVLKKIGERYGKSAGQVSLRWLIQKGLSAIPKSTNETHIRKNIDIFDFALTIAEMEEIDRIPDRKRMVKGEWAGVVLES